jgi:hypothetical protein
MHSKNQGKSLSVSALPAFVIVSSCAAAYVSITVGQAVSAYSDNLPPYVRDCSKGMFGTNVVSAPDVAVTSDYSANGTPLRDTPEAPIFFCEIGDDNRSL